MPESESAQKSESNDVSFSPNNFLTQIACTPPQVIFSKFLSGGEYRSVFVEKYFSLKHMLFYSDFCADSEYDVYFVCKSSYDGETG